MKKILTLLFVLNLFLYASNDLYSEDLNLTVEEINYLKSNPNIKVGGEEDWPPFDYVDINGKYQGIAKDILELVSKKTGLKFTYETGKSWKELVEDFKNNKLNILPAMYKNKQREEYTYFTQPYFTVKDYAFVRSDDNTISNIEDLKDKRVAVIEGYAIKHILLNKFPNINIINVRDKNEGLNSVLLNKADIYIDGYAVVMHTLKNNLLTGIKPAVQLNFYSNNLHIGINKQNPILASIITKTLETIPNYEINKIINIWLNLTKEDVTLKLTTKEKKWLDNNQTIRLAYMNYWPKNNNNENIHTEYINLLSKYGDININLVKYDTWKDGFKDATLGKNTHGILNLSWSEEREKNNFDYTQPYFFTPAYLIVKKENNTIKSINDLANKSIYTKKDAITNQIIKQLKYNITTINKNNDTEIHKALGEKNSKADALLTYVYDEKLLNKYNLKVADKFFNKYGEVHIGISKNQKEVFSILQKAYDNIPKNELTKIQNRDYSYTDKELPIYLTDEEKKWLKEHPVLKIGNEPDYAPWDFNKDGKPTGYSIDYLNILVSKLGIKLEHELNTWAVLTKKLQKKELDFLHSMYKNDSSRKNIIYTDPYKKVINAIFVHKNNNSIKSLEDLSDKVVSIPNGDSTIVSLKNLNSSIKFLTPDGYIESIKDIAFKHADATILELGVANYIINEFNIPNIKIVDEVEFKNESVDYSYCFGVRDDYPILVSILNKAMKTVTKEEKNQLDDKWLNYSNELQENKSEIKTVKLNNLENKWIEKNPTIKVIKFFDEPPFTLNTEKKSGYIYELIEYLANSTGLKIKYIDGFDSYDQMLDSLSKGDVDLLPTYPTSLDLGKDSTIVKSKTILKTPFVIIGNSTSKKINSVKKLFGKKVAVVKGYAQDRYLSKFPQIEKVYVKNNTEGFDAIRDGKASYYINNKANTDYILSKSFSTDLKIVFELPYNSFPPLSLSLGINGKKKPLVSILSKALEQIPYKKIKQIRDKWLSETTSLNISNLNLSKKEKDWIKEHQEIRFTGDPAWLPFEAFTDKGEYVGIVSEHLQLFENMLGIKFKLIKPKTWSDAVQMTLDGKVDMISEVIAENTVSKSMDYTLPYFKTPLVTIVHKDSNIKSIDDLKRYKNKKIAYVKDYGYVEELKKKYPDISFYEVSTVKEGLEKLALKQIDVMILTLTIGSYNITSMGLSELEIVGKLPIEMKLGFGIRKDWQKLIQILNRAIDSLDKQTQQNIMKNWLIEEDKKITLTPKEQKWIEKNKSIKYVYDINWAPFEWRNEVDEHTGIIHDFLTLIEEKTGLKLKPINTNNWKEALDLVQDKKAEMFSAIGETKERKEYLNFTKNTIFSTPYVFISRVDDKSDYLNVFDSLENKKVSLVGNYTIEDIIKKNQPNLKYTPVKTVKEGFEKVRDKKIDIFIVNAATAKYYINRLEFNELRIAAKTDYSLKLKIALRKELGETPISIIDKALDGVDENERSDIYFKWTEILVEKKIDWKLVYEILGATFIVLVGFSFWNRKLKQLVNKKTQELQELNQNLELKVNERTKELNDERTFIQSIMNSQTNFVLSSDGKVLRSANKAFYKFYNVKDTQEFIDKFGDCICDTFDTDKPDEFIQKEMNGELWLDYIYSRPNHIHKAKITRNNKEYIFTITTDKLLFNNEELKTAVFNDITELEETRQNIEMILSNIMLPVLITSIKDRKILYANSYAQKQYEIPIDELIGSDIDDIYIDLSQKDTILKEMAKTGFVENLEQMYKTRSGKEFIALLSVKPITYKKENAYIGMVVDITKQKEIEEEIRNINKLTHDSIQYASLIQHALIPSEDLFDKYFSDSFRFWEPKDIVGGDIYLFDELRSDDECLLFIIDCTGHGVPGAFVTMLVKAIERQIGAVIASDPTINVSPAWILQYFNKTMKKLLKQDNKDAIAKSNAGFDGGIIYFNKRDKILKFAGAETSLYYIENDELKIIKGNRHSIGYKKSDANYIFDEHTIEIEKDMKFYISTDGYIDQNGGEKGFSMGKTKFKNIILENHEKSFEEQKEIFVEKLEEYQQNYIRNDDITLIGFKI